MADRSRLLPTIRRDMGESVANTAIGYGLALLTQVIVFPLFGLHADPVEHLGIAAVFTAVSLVRSFVLRRVFRAMERRHG